MALAERADLIARLTLDDRFSGKVRGALGNLRGMETSFSKIGKLGQQGLKNAATNLAKIGAVAGGFVAINVKQGISSLAELEDATTSVDGAIKQMGLTGKLTSQQVATWANEIERNVQAAFDDKAIVAASTTLLRYGKVTEANLRPALEVMTDLAAKTGDVESAGNLLARALASPEKAAARLIRQGVVLTDVEQEQIAAFVKAGKVAQAQALVLDAVARSTKGAAAASKGPYNDAINILTDSVEDAQRVLGEGFLPVISKVADKLQDAVADEGFMREVREFGQNMAGAFDKAVEFAGNVPWGLIGQSLKTAGQGAKAIFDAFTMLPPWVQQAVITGWGLNKLTGGALGSIVGELGKGLVKGVLGMTAGVVNINAGVVNGGGAGIPAAGAARTGLSTLGKVALVGEAVGLVAAVVAVGQAVRDSSLEQAQGLHQVLDQSLASPQSVNDIQTKLAGIDTGIAKLKADPVAAALITGPTIAELERMRADVLSTFHAQNKTITAVESARGAIKWGADKTTSAAQRVAANVMSAKTAQIAASERARSAITSTTRAGDARITAAIRSIQRPIVSVSIVGNRVTTVYSTGGTVSRNVSYGSMNAGLLA